MLAQADSQVMTKVGHHQELQTMKVIVEAVAEQAVMRKPPSRIVWPAAKAPLAKVPSLKTGRGILPDRDDTEELSMEAPMSVSKPADLR